MVARKKDFSKEPFVSNYPPLAEWLAKHDARCMWQKMDKQMSIEGWLVGSRIVIVQVWADGHGWDLYTSQQSQEIESTFDDAERRCGVSK
jgi:hypothetical protein